MPVAIGSPELPRSIEAGQLRRPRMLFYFSGNAIRPSDLLDRVLPAGSPRPVRERVDLGHLERRPLCSRTTRRRRRCAGPSASACSSGADHAAGRRARRGVGRRYLRFRHQSAQPRGRRDGGARYQLRLRCRSRRPPGQGRRLHHLEHRDDRRRRATMLRRSTLHSTPLPPTHGNFAAFYASVGDTHARELGFDNGDGTETVYGAFTFRLANVIQNRDSVTVRALTESLKKLPKAEEQDAALPGRGQRSRDGDVHRPRRRRCRPTEAIVITKPAPTRGAAGGGAAPRSRSRARSTGRRRPRRCWSTARAPS